jgi:AcrR family transcriptional regulator
MSIVENGEIRPRGPGRPPARTDAETLHVILQAAGELFRSNGYASTGMSQVARRAGVSTKTLYRLVPTKAELFKHVITSRIGDFVMEVGDLGSGPDCLAAGLERLLIAYGRLTLEPETLAVHHLVLSECNRFPEIGRAFYEEAIERTGEVMAEWLDRQCRSGLIDLEDPRLAAGMLRGMMTLEPQRAVMLGQTQPPDAAHITKRARACARLFLEGCLSRPQ